MFSSKLVNENNYQEAHKNEILEVTKTKNMLTPLSEVSLENLVVSTTQQEINNLKKLQIAKQEIKK